MYEQYWRLYKHTNSYTRALFLSTRLEMYVDLNAYSFYTRHHRQESPQATTGHTSSYQEVFNLLNNSGQKGRYRFVFCFPALCRDVVLRSIAP